MPYIKTESRPQFDKEINRLVDAVNSQSDEKKNGTANYVIYKFICGCYPAISYDSVSDGMKAFLMAMNEFNRRKVEPYEDIKREENGDIL